MNTIIILATIVVVVLLPKRGTRNSFPANVRTVFVIDESKRKKQNRK